MGLVSLKRRQMTRDPNATENGWLCHDLLMGIYQFPLCRNIPRLIIPFGSFSDGKKKVLVYWQLYFELFWKAQNVIDPPWSVKRCQSLLVLCCAYTAPKLHISKMSQIILKSVHWEARYAQYMPTHLSGWNQKPMSHLDVTERDVNKRNQ